jgi:DNA-binding beta-propeller fold protein YncE
MKKVFSIIIAATMFVAAVNFFSCTHDTSEEVKPVVETNYPADIEAIIIAKCATAGCHNTQSKNGAGGLDLSTWDKLFEGSRGGAVIIPYRPDYSTFCYYTNTDSTHGLVLQPTMPYNGTPLSASEYSTLKNWIQNGAPDKNGFVKYSDNPSRKKFYAGCQGCDEVTIFDAASMLAMRYVHVGNSPMTEAPHMVKVAPNNQFWCTSFLGSNYFQKLSTADNSLLGQVDIGFGSWNTFAISSDSKKAYVVDFNTGIISFVDLDNMTKQNYNFGFSYPHGSALNKTDDTLYVTAQQGNSIWKIPVNDIFNFDQKNFTGGMHRFHEITFSPDGSKYFLTAQSTNLILAISTANDSILASIPVGVFPQEMGISQTHPYLFVSCMEDLGTFPGKTGAIYVINYNTLQVVGTVYTGHQPHGIAVDDGNNRVYVSNRNVTSGGPAPHHSSVCGGRNGYITAIDMSTLQLIPNFKPEVSVDPYGVGITH